MPYLLIRQVVLPIAGVHVEASILTRDPVPHGAFKTWLLTRDIASIGEVGKEMTSWLLDQDNLTTLSFMGLRESCHHRTSTSANPHPLCSRLQHIMPQ